MKTYRGPFPTMSARRTPVETEAAMLVDLSGDDSLPWGPSGRDQDEYERLALDSIFCGGQPVPDPPPTGLAESVESIALSFKGRDTDLGDLIAEELRTLAGLIRWTKSETVPQFRDRREMLEEWGREKSREGG